MTEKQEKPVKKPQEKRENPYKGLHSYEEADKNVFYGREQEKAQLVQLIKCNLLSVVFGKAGIGKTSLLNAGVFPLLRQEGFLPIPLRLNYSDKSPPLMQQIRDTITAELRNHRVEVKTQGKDEPAKSFAPGETLWEYFHRVNHCNPAKKTMVTPVLVLDQFEELFTLGKDHKDENKLIDELYWLIEDQFPTPLKERILKASKGDKKERGSSFSTAHPDVRVIISLKEGYLPHLTGLKSRITTIDRTMFRVLHLNGKQAREIITKTGGLQEKKLINHILRRFYPENVKDDQSIPDEKLEIEPTILSLLCHQLYDKKPLKSITKEVQDKILIDFYDSIITGIPDELQRYIETKLLTRGGFRTPRYLSPQHPGKKYIDQLVDLRILRKFYDGTRKYIEIAHDVMAPVIREKRNKRLEELRKQEFKKRIKRRFLKRAIAVAAGTAAILAFITVFAFQQKWRADKQFKIAQVNRLTSEALTEFPRDNTRALRIAEAAFEMGLPTPPERTYQALTSIGYSSYTEPFYITTLSHKEKKPIYTAVFSPDSRRLLTASEDGTAKIWTNEGKSLADLKHKKKVISAVFSPDNRRILTASWDQSAKLWDLKGETLVELKHQGIVSSAVFSPDGNTILTASRDNTAIQWDLHGKKLLELKHPGPVTFAGFSPNGQLILTVSWDKTAKLWNTHGDELAVFTHIGAVSFAAFSNNSQKIITASEDGTARIWNTRGQQLAELTHAKAISYAQFSPNDQRIVTASLDGIAKIWEIQANKPRQVAEIKHLDRIFTAVFSPQGQQILTASKDSTAKIWDLQGNLIADLNKHNSAILSARFSTKGQQVITASEDGTSKLWKIKDNPVVDLNKHTAEVKMAAFSPNREWIITASRDNTAKVWDLKGKLLYNLNKHKGSVYTAVFSPNSQLALTASADGTAKLWNLAEKPINHINLEHQKAVFSAVFSRNGQKIATASLDQSAKVWDLQGNLTANFPHPNGAVTSAVFSPDNRGILTAAIDGIARVWNLEENKPLKLKHNGAVSSAVFSPNGKWILTASEDATAKLWDLQGKLLLNLDKHDGVVFSALFSPDNRRIITASWGNTAKVWDLEGNLLTELNEHKDIVVFAAFSNDSRHIITTSRDHSAKLWSAQGILLADLHKHKGIVSYAVFSPDNHLLLTASKDKTAKLWYTPEAIRQWLKTARIPHLTNEDKEKLGIK